METLTFLPEDFVNLNKSLLWEEEQTEPNENQLQFRDLNDCPAERAAAREEGFYPIGYGIKYDLERLDEVRKRLLAGEESVTVNI